MVPEDAVAGSAYPLLGGVQITLHSVTNGVAGKAPTINFTLQDGSGKPLTYSQMSSLTFVIGGPDDRLRLHQFRRLDHPTPGYVM